MKKAMILIMGLMIISLVTMVSAAQYTLEQLSVPSTERLLSDGIAISDDGQKIAFINWADPIDMFNTDGNIIRISSNGGDTFPLSYNISESSAYWVSMSDDGTKIFSTGNTNAYISTNGGTSFTVKSIYPAVALSEYAGISTISGNGNVLMATGGEHVFISIDGGDTWSNTTIPSSYNYQISSSYDGQVILISNDGGYLILSTDGGDTFSEVTAAGNNYFYGAAVSGDGEKMCAVVYDYGDNDPGLMVSIDSGVTWEYHAIGDDGNAYCDIANGGNRIVMTNYYDTSYYTIDGGNNWVSFNYTGAYALAMNPGGSKFVTSSDVVDGNSKLLVATYTSSTPTSSTTTTTKKTGGKTRYVVDENGNVVGIQSNGQIQMIEPEESKSPFLSIASPDTTGVKTWFAGIWQDIKAFFK